MLDNCEHVLADAARLAESLLGAGPEIVVMVTSREPLGITGEVVRGVPSLAIPADDVSAADALTASAVRLFVERATAATDRFAVDDDNVATVVAICRQLDGIPLALELAAARIRAMPPAEIARRLSERFRLLTGGRGSLERHRTLLGTVAWSHDLLTDNERRVFRRLAVFPATFDLDAAAAIATDDNAGIDAVDCVLRLVDRSLVAYDPTSGRYRLLETLRQYGAERLADADETVETRDRHAAHYMQIAPALNWSTRLLWAELDNLRAAADWLTDQQRWADLLFIVRALFPIGVTTAAGDALGWYEAALDHLDDVDIKTRVDALGELGHIETRIGRDVGTAAWRMSIALADEHGAPHSQWAWHAETMASLYDGNRTGARRAEERAIAIARERHDSFCLVVANSTLAFVLASLGEFDESRRLADRAVRDAASRRPPRRSCHRHRVYGRLVHQQSVATRLRRRSPLPRRASARPRGRLGNHWRHLPPAGRHDRTRPRAARSGHRSPRGSGSSRRPNRWVLPDAPGGLRPRCDGRRDGSLRCWPATWSGARTSTWPHPASTTTSRNGSKPASTSSSLTSIPSSALAPPTEAPASTDEASCACSARPRSSSVRMGSVGRGSPAPTRRRRRVG